MLNGLRLSFGNVNRGVVPGCDWECRSKANSFVYYGWLDERARVTKLRAENVALLVRAEVSAARQRRLTLLW